MTAIRRVLLNGKPHVLTKRKDNYLDENNNIIDINDSEDLPPTVPNVIICVHLNYQSRLDEMKRRQPAAPTYFQKPVSCLNSNEKPVVRPPDCQYLNYEGEIALVVGKTTKNIELDKASEHILGYTIANDFGLHDFRETDENSMVRVKGSDTLGAVGPEIVEDWDFRNKTIKTIVNGEIKQKGNTNEMLWNPEYLLTDLTRSITLNKGDLILTGTPAFSRPVMPGSTVKVEVEGLGVLTNYIVEGKESLYKNCGAEPQDTNAIRTIALGSDNDI